MTKRTTTIWYLHELDPGIPIFHFSHLSCGIQSCHTRTCTVECIKHHKARHGMVLHVVQSKTCITYIYKTRTKVFPLDYWLQPSPLRLLTGCTCMTWRIADQLVCFKRILVYSDLKYDPPRRPRKMRIIDPRRSTLPFIRRQTGKHFLPTDEHFPLNHFVFLTQIFDSKASYRH